MNKKIYLILVLIPLILIYSCNKKDKEYYPSGNIKSLTEYNKNGWQKIITTYYDAIDNLTYNVLFRNKNRDSVVFYYKNGKIYKTGLQNFKQRKFGNWNIYTRDGDLSEIREYYIVKNNSVLNRNWYLNKKGDTLWYAKNLNPYYEFANDTLDGRNSTMISFDFYSKDTINNNLILILY